MNEVSNMNNTFLKDGDIKRFQLEDLTGKTVRIESSVFNGHSITTAKDIANGDMYILAESNEEENEMIDPGKKDCFLMFDIKDRSDDWFYDSLDLIILIYYCFNFYKHYINFL